MPVLSFNLLMYSISGIWRPIEWSSSCCRVLYGAYTLLMIYLMMFLMLTQFLDIVVVVDNIEDFVSNFLLFLSVISAFCKIFTGIARRGRIINLIETLEKEPCRARGQEEMGIQARFDRSIRSVCSAVSALSDNVDLDKSCSVSYMVLAMFSAVGAIGGGMLDCLRGQLPFQVWVPYDCSSPLLFWLTSLQEMTAVLIGTLVNIATETLVLGFCLQTCAQIEILKHRLGRVAPDVGEERQENSRNPSNDGPRRTRVLSEHIRHHLCIIRYAKIFNEVYSQVFFIQFFVSILVLCSCVYHVSSHMNLADLATMTVYTFCMFVQIFVYCWAGNEVILKSTELSEAVYQMDWMLLEIGARKDLLMIMKRSTRPIKFTSSFLVTLSLDSYGNILKASYSAFSVLQQA